MVFVNYGPNVRNFEDLDQMNVCIMLIIEVKCFVLLDCLLHCLQDWSFWIEAIEKPCGGGGGGGGVCSSKI